MACSGHLSCFSFVTNNVNVALIPNVYPSVSNTSYLSGSQPVALRESAGLCKCWCLEEAPVIQDCLHTALSSSFKHTKEETQNSSDKWGSPGSTKLVCLK